MDRSEYLLKRKIEQSLWGRPMTAGKSEIPASKKTKAAVRAIIFYIFLPVAGIIGAYLIYSAIRIIFGLPTLASLF